MTDEKPKALSWVDEEQLAARVERNVEPSFAELIYGNPAHTRTVVSLLQEVHRQRGCHVGRR